MADYTKRILSNSTNGRAIKIVATATSGTLIHTAVSGTTDFDEVYLYANNIGSATIKLTIEWGGQTSPDDLIEVSIPGEAGLVLVVPGLVLQNGLAIRAFAETTAVINITGFVNRITA